MVSKRGFIACLGLLFALTTAPTSAQDYQLNPGKFFSWFCEHGETFSAARTPYVAREMAMAWPESPNPELSVGTNDKKLENGHLFLGQKRWGAKPPLSLHLEIGPTKIHSSSLASRVSSSSGRGLRSDYQIFVGGHEGKGLRVTEDFLEVFGNVLGAPCKEAGNDYDGYHQECVTDPGPWGYEVGAPKVPTVKSEGYVQAVGSDDLAMFAISWDWTENPVELACETNRHFWDSEAAERRQAERKATAEAKEQERIAKMVGRPRRDSPEGMQDDGDGLLSADEFMAWVCKYGSFFLEASTNSDLVVEILNDFPFTPMMEPNGDFTYPGGQSIVETAEGPRWSFEHGPIRISNSYRWHQRAEQIGEDDAEGVGIYMHVGEVSRGFGKELGERLQGTCVEYPKPRQNVYRRWKKEPTREVVCRKGVAVDHDLEIRIRLRDKTWNKPIKPQGTVSLEWYGKGRLIPQLCSAQ